MKFERKNIDFINENHNKENFMSYFVRHDDCIFKFGLKNIWFKIDVLSMKEHEKLSSINTALKMKHKLNAQGVYIEIENNVVSYSTFKSNGNSYIDGECLDKFTKKFIIKRLESIVDSDSDHYFVDEIVRFLLFHSNLNFINILSYIRKNVSDDLYRSTVMNYLNVVCIERNLHKRMNIGYLQYLLGVL